jgi:hypothetical protein
MYSGDLNFKKVPKFHFTSQTLTKSFQNPIKTTPNTQPTQTERKIAKELKEIDAIML